MMDDPASTPCGLAAQVLVLLDGCCHNHRRKREAQTVLSYLRLQAHAERWNSEADTISQQQHACPCVGASRQCEVVGCEVQNLSSPHLSQMLLSILYGPQELDIVFGVVDR